MSNHTLQQNTHNCSDDLTEALVVVDKLKNQLIKSNDALKLSRDIVANEKKRWEIIHNNPVTDKASIEYKDDNQTIILHVTIDTGISTVINSQPIERTYTFTAQKPRARIFPSPYIGVAGLSYMHGDSIRPLIGIGITGEILPFSDAFKRVSTFLFTSIYSVGVGVSYCIVSEYKLDISLLYGMTYVSSVEQSFGFGLSFHL